MDILYVGVGLVVVGLLVYLFISLIKPEWFG